MMIAPDQIICRPVEVPVTTTPSVPKRVPVKQKDFSTVIAKTRSRQPVEQQPIQTEAVQNTKKPYVCRLTNKAVSHSRACPTNRRWWTPRLKEGVSYEYTHDDIMLILEGVDTSMIINMKNLFAYFDTTNIAVLDLSYWNVSHVIDMEGMFAGCHNLTMLNVSNWDTTNVQNMSCMFAGCDRIEELDLSTWNVAGVVKMARMFANCSSLKKVDIEWQDIHAVDTASMFTGCSSLEEN